MILAQIFRLRWTCVH